MNNSRKIYNFNNHFFKSIILTIVLKRVNKLNYIL